MSSLICKLFTRENFVFIIMVYRTCNKETDILHNIKNDYKNNIIIHMIIKFNKLLEQYST